MRNRVGRAGGTTISARNLTQTSESMQASATGPVERAARGLTPSATRRPEEPDANSAHHQAPGTTDVDIDNGTPGGARPRRRLDRDRPARKGARRPAGGARRGDLHHPHRGPERARPRAVRRRRGRPGRLAHVLLACCAAHARRWPPSAAPAATATRAGRSRSERSTSTTPAGPSCSRAAPPTAPMTRERPPPGWPFSRGRNMLPAHRACALRAKTTSRCRRERRAHARSGRRAVVASSRAPFRVSLPGQVIRTWRSRRTRRCPPAVYGRSSRRECGIASVGSRVRPRQQRFAIRLAVSL